MKLGFVKDIGEVFPTTVFEVRPFGEEWAFVGSFRSEQKQTR
jgi:hypothetical protein